MVRVARACKSLKSARCAYGISPEIPAVSWEYPQNIGDQVGISSCKSFRFGDQCGRGGVGSAERSTCLCGTRCLCGTATLGGEFLCLLPIRERLGHMALGSTAESNGWWLMVLT